MRVVLIALGLMLVGTEAQAINTYNPTRMLCNDLKQTIFREGAVFLRWTSPTAGVPRYGRYIANSNYCPINERAYPNLIPSKDKKSCGVYQCRPYLRGDGFSF